MLLISAEPWSGLVPAIRHPPVLLDLQDGIPTVHNSSLIAPHVLLLLNSFLVSLRGATPVSLSPSGFSLVLVSSGTDSDKGFLLPEPQSPPPPPSLTVFDL